MKTRLVFDYPDPRAGAWPQRLRANFRTIATAIHAMWFFALVASLVLEFDRETVGERITEIMREALREYRKLKLTHVSLNTLMHPPGRWLAIQFAKHNICETQVR